MDLHLMEFHRYNTVIVGTGAAGYNAALRLYEMGQKDIAIITEGRCMGTSRNTGSDKQTYYKLSLCGSSPDSVRNMAETLFSGGCMDGDIALAEAAGSIRSFFHLTELGVPFPTNEIGEYVGYKTDHDPINRGTSAGPYTSKYMTEALEKKAAEYGIPVHDRRLAVRLLVRKEEKRVCGILALNQDTPENEEQRFTLFSAENVIWATGGEAGMYQSSVYPYAQSGGSGVLFEAGVSGKNLTESQFGIASTRFRWNLSGSFQQAIPRYLSTDADGNDEREFLTDSFDSPEKMLNAIFLKGYQWPFDPRKVKDEGSSYIDLLIYREEILKGRRVFIDYRRNPSALETDGTADFAKLTCEARDYLANCHALSALPIDRLRAINPAAIQVYLDHGIDLTADKLEISVCAQHNNGGAAGDCWWESEIRHLFPVGEVNGTHGVYRPGGTALNAGQVGGLRAAQKIVHCYGGNGADQEEFLAEFGNEIREILTYAEEALQGENAVDLKWETECLRRRMSRYGACIRSEEGLVQAIRENREQCAGLKARHVVSGARKLPELFRLKELLTAQYVYLESILDYIRKGGVSRSSYLVYNKNGALPHEGIEECFRNTTEDPNSGKIQEIRYNAEKESCEVLWRAVRPIPDTEQWFETAWRSFRTGEIYQ